MLKRSVFEKYVLLICAGKYPGRLGDWYTGLKSKFWHPNNIFEVVFSVVSEQKNTLK